MACILFACAGHKYFQESDHAGGSRWAASGSSPSRNSITTISSYDNPTLLWKRRIKTPLNIEPTVSSDVIFLPTVNGDLWLINIFNGEILTKRKYKQPLLTSFILPDSNSASDSIGLLCDNSRKVKAVNWRLNETIWEMEIGSPCFDPIIINDKAIIFSSIFGIKCVRLADGKRLWEFNPRGQFSAPAAANSEFVVVPFEDGSITAYNIKDGQRAWTFRATKRTRNSPVLFENSAFVSLINGEVIRLNLLSGEQLWKTALQADNPSGVSVDDSMVYLGTQDRQIIALRIDNGLQVWKTAVIGPVAVPPTAINEHILVSALDHRLYLADKIKGDIGFTFETSGMLKVRPVVIDGKIIVASEDGYLYCLTLK